MIRRETTGDWLLISQVDHAQIAGTLAAAWGRDPIPALPLREWLVPAIRDHDEGWRDWEGKPGVTEEGLPRQFTEMPMADFVAISSASIETCAAGNASYAEALRRLRAGGGELTPDDAVVLHAILRHRRSVGADRLATELLAEGELSVESIEASIACLESRGLIRRLPNVVGGPAFAIDLPTTGSSPLGGIWVSKHFSALAEAARENRRDNPDELAILTDFLDQQATNQSRWAKAVREFAGEELDRVIDTGFRYVRFFDLISLWLCMAERDSTWEAMLSSSLSLTFTPRSTREIAVDPWPFIPHAIELSVPAVRIDADTYPDDDALQSAIAAGSRTTLHWVLVRP